MRRLSAARMGRDVMTLRGVTERLFPRRRDAASGLVEPVASSPSRSESKWRRWCEWLACGLCVMLFFLPNMLAAFPAPKGAIAWTDNAAMALQFWVLWMALWGRTGVAMLLALPFALTWPLELWIRWHYGTSISANFVALAFETNFDELANLASSMGWFACLPLAWLALYAGVVWLLLHWKVQWKGRLRWATLILLGVVSAIQSLAVDGHEGAEPLKDRSSDTLGLRERQEPGGYWADAFPVNQVVALQIYWREKAAMAVIRERIQNYRFGAFVPHPDQAAETVVLVIGESSTAQRWSLLGYERETNPRLKTLPLSIFTNVESVASLTRIAVPAALAHRPVLTLEGLVDRQAQPSLVAAFNEAGYDTYWFSNQAPMGRHDSSIAVYAAEAKHTRFLNPSSYFSRGSFDEVLLPALDGALAANGPKLVVLHTLGSHFNQSLRYPDAFARFLPTPTMPSESIRSSRVQMEGNAYDNSVLYTDYVLSKIIQRVASQGGRSVVGYFSDHGVDAHRTSCRNESMVARTTLASRHVPVFFWMSPAFKESNPSILQRLHAHRDQPYTTTAMFSSLLEISGISLSSISSDALESLLRAPMKETSARRSSGTFADSCRLIEKMP